MQWAEVQGLEQAGAGGVGHDALAVGEADVAGQLLPSAGGVDPHHRRPGQGRRAQPEQVLGDVVEQHPHVEGAGTAQSHRHRRPPFALGHHLAPGPCVVAEQQADSVVVAASGQQRTHRGRVGRDRVRCRWVVRLRDFRHYPCSGPGRTIGA